MSGVMPAAGNASGLAALTGAPADARADARGDAKAADGTVTNFAAILGAALTPKTPAPVKRPAGQAENAVEDGGAAPEGSASERSSTTKGASASGTRTATTTASPASASSARTAAATAAQARSTALRDALAAMLASPSPATGAMTGSSPSAEPSLATQMLEQLAARSDEAPALALLSGATPASMPVAKGQAMPAPLASAIERLFGSNTEGAAERESLAGLVARAAATSAAGNSSGASGAGSSAPAAAGSGARDARARPGRTRDGQSRADALAAVAAELAGTAGAPAVTDAVTLSAAAASALGKNGISAAADATATHSSKSGAEAPASTDDVTRVRSDLAPLVPAFRGRLERVITRMRAEGHDVAVAETLRTPARQAWLYEQGRTRPGDVVTWTKESDHQTGRAADLVVDGSYDDAGAYRDLQRIARQEGLRTLGLKDPGHIELAGPSTGATPASRRLTATVQLPTGATVEVAQPAPVAPVARVASPAPVAAVARVALPAAMGLPAAAAPQAAHVSGTHNERPAAGAATAEAPRGETPASGRARAREASRPTAPLAAPQPAATPAAAATPQAATHGASPGTTATQAAATPVAGPAALDLAGRVDQIDALRADAASQPVSRMTVKLDAANGGQDRIRVDVRGDTVGASIQLQDATAADRLTARVGELQQALERHGLTADTVSVSAVQALRSDLHGTDGARVAAAVLDADARAGNVMGNNASQHPGSTPDRDRGGNPAREDAWQQQQDASRNRSRREHRGEQNR